MQSSCGSVFTLVDYNFVDYQGTTNTFFGLCEENTMKSVAAVILNLFCLAAINLASDEVWEDSETLSMMWSASSRRNTEALSDLLSADTDAAFYRSSDGRGPLFWAYEFGHREAIDILEGLGVDPLAKDADGKTPKQLGIENAAINAQRDIAFAEAEDDYDDEDELNVPAFGDDHFADEDDDEYAEDEL